MAAKFQKQILHAAQCLIHMVAFYRAPGALHTVLTPCQYKGGLVVGLPHPPGNDPGQRLMTVRQINHQHIIVRKLSIHLLKGLLHAGLGHILAFLVEEF